MLFKVLILVCSLVNVPNSHDCNVLNSVRSYPVGDASLLACMMTGQSEAALLTARGQLELGDKEYITVVCIGGPHERVG
jgi:hypothetical protein